MRLDKLRGYGPWFASAVPFIFLVSVFFLVVVGALVPAGSQEAPAWFAFAVVAWILSWGVIVLAGVVVAVDLEWIEHPRTNTPMTYVGLAGMVVATLGFLVFLLDAFANFLGDVGLTILAFLVFAGFGVYLVVMNLVGRRAGLLGRVLPWLGIVAGAFFLLAAVLVLVGLAAGAGFGFIPGWILYLAWSAWLGFRLRGKAPEAAKAPA